jgi:hypothetical protein
MYDDFSCLDVVCSSSSCLVVLLSVLTCSFFVILYSLEWGAKRANEWLITMMLSFGQSILVIDPLKVFVITAVISFLIRRPYDDETMDFSDPFTATLLSSHTLTDVDEHNVFDNKKVKGNTSMCTASRLSDRWSTTYIVFVFRCLFSSQ